MKQEQFQQHSHLSASLINAVIEQMGGYESFTDYAEDVANYGAAAGFCGFTYYSDTLPFYDANRADIKEAARNMADDMGDELVSFVRSFRCLPDSTEDEVGATLYGSAEEHDTQVANALSWFALEEVCRSYADALESV